MDEMADHGGARPGAGRRPYGSVPMRPCTFTALPAEQKAWKRTAKANGKNYNTWVRETLNAAVQH